MWAIQSDNEQEAELQLLYAFIFEHHKQYLAS